MDSTELGNLIEMCLLELVSVRNGDFNPDRTDRVAAMFLEAQLKLGFFMEDLEFKAKSAKNEISRVEAEKYFEYKTNGAKLTEAALGHSIARDKEVVSSKIDAARAESDLKKYNSIMNTLRDGHVYFRTINKAKSNWSE